VVIVSVCGMFPLLFSDLFYLNCNRFSSVVSSIAYNENLTVAGMHLTGTLGFLWMAIELVASNGDSLGRYWIGGCSDVGQSTTEV
jgi:hypothetical protein